MSATAVSINLDPRRWWGSYCSALETKPLRIKAATAAVGFTLGDLVAQLATKPKGQSFKCDFPRTARLALYGGLIGGPVGHYWYNYLDQVVYPSAPKSAKAIVAKIALDQTVMSPIGAVLFFSYIKLMDGFQVFSIAPTLQEKLLPTCINSLKLWPAAHAVNFGLIPASQRILYVNVIAIGWTALLSVSSAQQSEVTDILPEVVPEVVMVGPVPVVNVLEPHEEPVTASHDFQGPERPPVEPLPYQRSLRQRARGALRQVASVGKFW